MGHLSSVPRVPLFHPSHELSTTRESRRTTAELSALVVQVRHELLIRLQTETKWSPEQKNALIAKATAGPAGWSPLVAGAPPVLQVTTTV